MMNPPRLLLTPLYHGRCARTARPPLDDAPKRRRRPEWNTRQNAGPVRGKLAVTF